MNFLKLFRLITLVGVFIFMISCGNSMDKDAQKAADLTTKSLDYIRSRDLDKSEEAYLESKLIKQKYTDNSEAFYKLYMTFLDKKQEK